MERGAGILFQVIAAGSGRPSLAHHPALGPWAGHKYHSICSKLERTRLAVTEIDLDFDLLRQIADTPAASQRGNEPSCATLLPPRGASSKDRLAHDA